MNGAKKPHIKNLWMLLKNIETNDLPRERNKATFFTMLIDIHVHSNISPCSVMEVEDILTRARACGLDGVCITDHDTMDARHLVREGLQPDGLCVIVGMEYTTPEGDFLVFGPFEALEPGMSALRLLRHVRREGGAAVAAHPFRKVRPLSDFLAASTLCSGVEVLNGRNNDQENHLAQWWSTRYNLARTGGSDAHTLEELGTCPTWFTRRVRNREEFVAALRHGLCLPARPQADLGRGFARQESPLRAIA